ncbi:SUMF1/EgtB/PvdO family nonheme iron enzyme [Halochromatium roseum]|uniref:SUMF1/EgtB/PvdO family nonheme iron enzyme n=1 Tax=Halochromatium roseum TaxID=391920 RepID=UPI0019112A3F|nr:SUMF1/EgtB/PvdO family nonheme iron enzyme [Halochromatium roseum]
MAAGLFLGGWWLAGKPWPLTNWRWLDSRLADTEPAPLRAALDRSAFARAESEDTEAAYQTYLERCETHSCAYRGAAEARIAALHHSAAQAAQTAQLQRRAADLDAYSQAIRADTKTAYQIYLDRCATHGCRFRAQAEQQLDALQSRSARLEQQSILAREAAEQVARATELEQQIEQLTEALDRTAFERAKRADTETAYRSYLDQCDATGCWHREPAENRLAQLTAQRRRFANEPEMVALAAGCFEMSHPMGRASKRASRSQQVCVDAFKIARHEITFSQYDLFARATGRDAPDDEGWGRAHRPVINVSWEDATAYAAWLAEQTGRGYRLPTEAEWEYAARAGTETTRFWGNAPNEACTYANVHDQVSRRENGLSSPHHACDDGYATTAPVGGFKPNAWGLHDMLGNVWEWTCSVYSGEFDGIEQRCASAGHAGFRSIRGGAWHSGPRQIASAARSGALPDKMYGGLGFRVVED